MDSDVEVLIEAVETAFEVKFASGELSDDTSLEELATALRARLPDETHRSCFTSIVFWRIRRAFIELSGLSKSAIKPSTPIELVLPQTHRRLAWLALGEKSGFRLPGLEYSGAFGFGMTSLALVPAFVLPIALGGGWWFLLSFALWPITVALLVRCLRPFADRLPYHTQTVGDLCKLVAGLNYGALSKELGPSSESELIGALRSLVADLIDVDERALAGENPRLIDLVLANDGFRAQV